jgi:hypothetical protein
MILERGNYVQLRSIDGHGRPVSGGLVGELPGDYLSLNCSQIEIDSYFNFTYSYYATRGTEHG